MPNSKEQIVAEYDTNIQNIRASYPERQEISHEKYHNQLNAESERYENELTATFPPEPPRDLLAEIDEIKARLDKITRVNGVA